MNRFIALLSPLAFLLLFTALPAQSPDSIQSRQGPRWIGVTTGPASAALRAQLAIPRNQGIVVRGITPDSPAAKAGLRTNDLLLSVDETILSRPRDLSRLVGQTDRPQIAIEFLRRGRKEKVFVHPVPRRDVSPQTENNSAPKEQRFFRNLIGQIAPIEAGAPDAVAKTNPPQQQTGPRLGGARLLSNLPNNFRIALQRNAGGSPRFIVEREGQRWEMDGSNFSEWGQALLPLAEGLLGSDAPVVAPPEIESNGSNNAFPQTEVPLPNIELPSELPPLVDETPNPPKTEN